MASAFRSKISLKFTETYLYLGTYFYQIVLKHCKGLRKTGKFYLKTVTIATVFIGLFLKFYKVNKCTYNWDAVVKLELLLSES